MRDDAVLAELLEALDKAPAARILDTTFRKLREPLGLRSLWLYVADYAEEQLRLVPAPSSPPPAEETLSARGTVPGRVYFSREPVETSTNGATVLWAPVFRYSENIGVLGFGLDRTNGRARALAPAIATILGAAVIGARRHSDVFERARAARDLQIAAALQWELLPLPTYRDDRVEVAGRIEPAYDIGGDAFDFAANADRMEVAVFDAMGHGLPSTLLTTLTVGAYRYFRRKEEDLQRIAEGLDRAVRSHTGGESFVTGHLCRLDLDAGVLRWVNAGHPPPLLIRDHTATALDRAKPMLPLGLEGRSSAEVEVALQPDDVLLYYSDGVIEARSGDGQSFGMERFMDLAGRHGDPQTDLVVTVRLILDAVVEHSGAKLRDDATLVALRWNPAS